MLVRDIRHTGCKNRMLNFRKAKFQLFKQLVSKNLWETVLKDQEMKQIYDQ